MEVDVEINCLSLSGSKVLRTPRPKKHKTDRSENGPPDLCLSTRIMHHPITPPNSPLVMQMYNHKKTRESVVRRVKEQTDRAKKKRLVYLKTTSVLGLSSTPGHERSKNKAPSPRRSHNSGSQTNYSVKLPRIDDTNEHALTSGITSHGERKNPTLRTKQLNGHKSPENDDHRIDNKSNRRIKFNIVADKNDDNDNDDDDNSTSGDYDDDDASDDNKSYDSLAIQSIFVNNCSNDSDNDKTSQTGVHSSHRRSVTKSTPWTSLHESYKGYFYKDNGAIVLTKKYQSVSQHPNLNTKTRTESRAKQNSFNKMYRWGYMDPGRILNKQISSLSITGTHA